MPTDPIAGRDDEPDRTFLGTMLDPVGIFTAARDEAGEIADFVVEYLNDAACRVIGEPAEAVVGKTIGALAPAWRDAALLQRYAGVVRSGRPLALDAYPYGIESGDETLGRYLDLRAAKLGDGIVATWRDVTGRVEMELKLREASAYTRELIESSIDAMLTTDAAGVIRDVNRRLEELLGASRDELIGSRFRDFSIDREAAADAIHEVFSTGRVVDRRLVVRGRHGRSTPISFNANTYAGLGGEVQGLFATLRDATELLRSEQHLRRRDDILEAVAFLAERVLSTGGWRTGVEAALEHLGRAAGADLAVLASRREDASELRVEIDAEWTADGVAGVREPLAALADHASELEPWVDALSKGAVVDGVTHDLPEPQRRFVGSLGVSAFVVAPITTDDRWWGMVALAVTGRERRWSAMEVDALRTAADIVGAAVVRERTEGQIRDLAGRFSTVVATTPDGFWILDLQGRLLDVNDAYCRMSGYSRGELLTMTVHDVVVADVAEIAPRIHLVRETGFRRFESRHRRKDGSEFDADVSASFRPEEDRILVFVRDITERKRTVEALRDLNQHLEARVAERTAELEGVNRELEGFSYSVSHDLRAPLRAIQGFANILEVEHRERLDDEARRVLGVIMDSTRRMGELIDDLLAFSRTGRRELEMSSIDMTALARSVVAEVRTHHVGRDVVVEVGDLEPARGDEGLIRQALMNLVDNAFKFTRPVDGARVEVSSEARGDRAAYAVRDNGVGYDDRYADKLFQVFQRLHSATEFEGTGIGLALVHRIVERHGGAVSAEGSVGGGAVFRFSLPRAKE